MKELRFDAADGVWRFAFAFDPTRKAIVLCGWRHVRRQPEAVLPAGSIRPISDSMLTWAR
jgi:hypothetical protein